MSLHIVSIPIGHPGDITLRAIETLKSCDLIIGEERKVAARFLKSIGLQIFELDLLNEHSDQRDIDFLTEQCQEKKVALISDCGTPVFCDPGALLIQSCRQKNITIEAVPGVSSLMTLLSLSGRPLKDFQFHGFIPAKSEKRQAFLKDLQREKQTSVIMDTPYRLRKTLTELAEALPKRQALLGIDLTQPEEVVLEGTLSHISKDLPRDKGEFVLLLYS